MLEQIARDCKRDLIASIMHRLLGEGSTADACRWHLSGGGGRVRARLATAAADAANVPFEDAAWIAAGCELLHNASLVHDDLQDRDEERRGDLSVWVKFGVETAISVGDLMISAGYAALARFGVTAIQMAHSAVTETIGGQSADLAGGVRCDPDRCLAIAEAKSGPLLALPVRLVLSRTDAGQSADEAVRGIAAAIARAYQICDDFGDLARDAARQSPNILLSLAAAGHSDADARANAIAVAGEALAAARHDAAMLPSGAGAAFLALAARLEAKLETIGHAA